VEDVSVAFVPRFDEGGEFGDGFLKICGSEDLRAGDGSFDGGFGEDGVVGVGKGGYLGRFGGWAGFAVEEAG